MEILNQGSKDVFLAKVRAEFDVIENQTLKSLNALKQFSIAGSQADAMPLFMEMSDTTQDGERYVWRHVGVAGMKQLGTRKSGGQYPEAEWIRGYETAVYDPDVQISSKFVVAEERQNKEAVIYRPAIDRAQKLLAEIDRQNIADPLEVFNLAFTAPASQPVRFFVRGNLGLDGNYTALGERLVSTQHARADGGATQSNASNTSGLANAFSDTIFYTSREQGATFKDDVGKPMPMMGGKVALVIPPANGLPRLAAELTGSEYKIDTANNNINVNYGALGRYISSPYLLSSYYVSGVANTAQWFMVDESTRDPKTGTGLIKIQFVALETRTEREQSIDSIVYKVKEEYVYGFVDWRNIIGSNGSGASYTS